MPGPLIYAVAHVITNAEAVQWQKWGKQMKAGLWLFEYKHKRQETAHDTTCLYRGKFSKKTLPLFQQLPLADEDGPERGEVHQWLKFITHWLIFVAEAHINAVYSYRVCKG